MRARVLRSSGAIARIEVAHAEGREQSSPAEEDPFHGRLAGGLGANRWMRRLDLRPVPTTVAGGAGNGPTAGQLARSWPAARSIALQQFTGHHGLAMERKNNGQEAKAAPLGTNERGMESV